MQASAKELAEWLQGTIDGDPSVLAKGVSKIDDSQPDTLGFLANSKYESFIYSCKNSIVLVSQDFVPTQPIRATLIRVADPYAAFTILLQRVAPKVSTPVGIHETAVVSATAQIASTASIGAKSIIEEQASIGEGTIIYPNVFVGQGVSIGKNCILYPGVVIYHHCIIGDDCILHAGAVIGSDGFGFAPDAQGVYQKIPQLGHVEIENQVEIGANTTIDRATLGCTRIGFGVKIDNLVQIAHNVEIGSHTVIAAQAGISGSTKIGSRCMIGGQVGFVGHITVADGTQIGAQSGIPKSITEEGKAWIGSPIMELREAFKSQAVIRNLPELAKRVQALEQALKKITTEQ